MQFAAAEPTASPFPGRPFDRRQFLRLKVLDLTPSVSLVPVSRFLPLSRRLFLSCSSIVAHSARPSHSVSALQLHPFSFISTSLAYFWSQMHQLFMSLHGRSDKRAINKSSQGRQITPEHPSTTHVVPHEDANTHVHTHAATTAEGSADVM